MDGQLRLWSEAARLLGRAGFRASTCHRSRDCDKAAPLLPCSSASSHPRDILLPTASDIKQIWKQT